MNGVEVNSGNATGLSTDLSAIAANIMMHGDVSGLDKSQKIEYIGELCRISGINPMMKPFDFIKLQGREVVYINKVGAGQLRRKHKLSITDVKHTVSDGMIFVTVSGHDANERYDSSTAALTLPEKKGEAYCNQVMKCETKAKRRFALSMCGIGAIDESDITFIQNDVPDDLNGEIEARKKLFEQAKTIEELSSLWVSSTPQMKSSLEEVKDDMKKNFQDQKKKKNSEEVLDVEIECVEVQDDKA